jgi:hypothetical protein
MRFGRDDRDLVLSGRGVAESEGLAKLEGQTLLRGMQAEGFNKTEVRLSMR